MISTQTQSRLICGGFVVMYVGLLGLLLAASSHLIGPDTLSAIRLVLAALASLGGASVALGHFLPVRTGTR